MVVVVFFDSVQVSKGRRGRRRVECERWRKFKEGEDKGGRSGGKEAGGSPGEQR